MHVYQMYIFNMYQMFKLKLMYQMFKLKLMYLWTQM